MPRYIDAEAIHYVEIGKGVEIALASEIDKIPTVSDGEVRGVGCPVCQCKDPLPEDGMTHEFYIRGTMLWYYDQLFGWEGTKINYCPSCGARMKGAEDDD